MGVSLDTDKRTLYLEGVIWSEDISAMEVREGLKAIGSGPLTIRINCVGGDVYESIAILAAIGEHEGEITTWNDGICASGGVDLYLAGDVRKAVKRAEWMVHTAHTIAGGNHYDFAEIAKVLQETDRDREAYYRERLPDSSDAITTWFDGKDHYFRAQVAYETGMLTEQAAVDGDSVDSKSLVLACKSELLRIIKEKQAEAIRELSARMKDKEPSRDDVEAASSAFGWQSDNTELRLRLARAK